jgi:hypothetical protein
LKFWRVRRTPISRVRTERDTAKEVHFGALWRYRLTFVSLLFVGIRLVLRTALGMSRSITHAGAWSLAPSLARTSRSTPASAIRFAAAALGSRLSMRSRASRPPILHVIPQCAHRHRGSAEHALRQSSLVEKTPKTRSTFQPHKNVLGIGRCRLNVVIGEGEYCSLPPTQPAGPRRRGLPRGLRDPPSRRACRRTSDQAGDFHSARIARFISRLLTAAST